MRDTYNQTLLEVDLIQDEGRKYRIYIDTADPPNVTGGVGRNLSANGFSESEIALMLSNDINTATAALDKLWPWWRTLPPGAQRVMANLCFNMGAGRLGGFTHFLAAMRQQDWHEAVMELKNSAWFAQVGLRGPRMCARLEAL